MRCPPQPLAVYSQGATPADLLNLARGWKDSKISDGLLFLFRNYFSVVHCVVLSSPSFLFRGCSLAFPGAFLPLYYCYSWRNSFFLFHVFASLLPRSFVFLLRFLILLLLESSLFGFVWSFLPAWLYCRVLCYVWKSSLYNRTLLISIRPSTSFHTDNASAVSGQRQRDMAPATQAPPNIFEDAPRAPTKPSVIRAILSAKAHKRNLSADEPIAPKPVHRNKLFNSLESSVDGQNQYNQQPLTERAANRDAGDGAPKSPTKSDRIGLHKKTKSAVSLKSLMSYMERKDNRAEDLPDEESQEWKPKKVKSANSLTAILKRSQRSRKNSTASSKDGPNKENRSPSDLSDSMPSPVWTQYTARSSLEQPAPRRSQDKRRTLHDEASLYTPRAYEPQQQRNFYDLSQTSLTKRSERKPRPKSEILSGNRKVKEVLGAMRTPSDNACPTDAPEPPSPTKPQGRPRRFSRPRSHSRPRSGIEQKPEQKPDSSPKKASRVQAAISAFNAKEQVADLHRMNVKELESEFEKLLVSLGIVPLLSKGDKLTSV